MTTQLFSSYGAARVLERDRQTIERTVRGLAPDAYEKGKPRWRLARIVEALSQRRGARASTEDQALDDQLVRLDALDARVLAVPTLEKRRDLVRELFVVLRETDCMKRDDARRSGEDARLTGLRCDEHTLVSLATLREPCGRNFEEILGEFNTVAETNA